MFLDAVNNISEALSSVITIIGTRLAGKAPDKKHSYGCGRLEYMSQIIVAAIVLYAGVTSLVGSGVHQNYQPWGRGTVKVDICFTAVGMVDTPTDAEIAVVMNEMQSNPQKYHLIS